MSPPPVKMLDTPKSPPMVRADPRRKALEANPPKIIPTTVQQHMIQDHTNMPGNNLVIWLINLPFFLNYSQLYII